MNLELALALKNLAADAVKKLKGKLFICVALMLLSAGFQGIGLLLLLPLLQAIGVGGDQDVNAHTTHFLHSALDSLPFEISFSSVLTAFLGLITCYASISYAKDSLSSDLQQDYTHHLRRKLINAISASSWEHLSKLLPANGSNIIAVEISKIGTIIHHGLLLASTSILLLVYAAASVVISPQLTAVALCGASILLLSTYSQHARAAAMGESLMSSQLNLHKATLEILGGIKTIKSLNAEKPLSEEFDTLSLKNSEHSKAFVSFHARSQSLLKVGGAIVLTLIVYVAQATYHITASELLVLVVIFSRIAPSISQIHHYWQRMIHAAPSVNMYWAYLRECQVAVEHENAAEEYSLSKQLSAESISLIKNGENILKDISFTLPANTTTAIVGPSGSGKSTLADIIAGLLNPSSGHLVADHTPIINPRNWRNLVAYVNQETFLLNRSVRDNLCLGAKNTIPEDQIWRALDNSAARTFVEGLSYGLDTIIGVEGTQLSGGERQRLSIARALLSGAKLLILDEATNALDSENKTEIHNTIRKLTGSITIVIVTHDSDSLVFADTVLKLNEGTLEKTIIQQPKPHKAQRFGREVFADN